MFQQNDPWAAFPLVDQTPQRPAGPGYIPSVRPAPNPPAPPSPIDLQANDRANRGSEREDRGQINDVWNRFNSSQEAQQFRQARVATQQMQRMARSGRPADDLGLIFSFMRVLDPASTVREGEFALAQGTAGLPDRIRNYYEQVRSGTRLTPAQRNDMVATAYQLYTERARSYNETAENYRQQGLYLGAPPQQLGRMFPTANAPRTEDARRQNAGRTPDGSPWWDWHGHTNRIRVLGRRPAR